MKTTLPPLYKEGFEVFSREKKAENMVDYLLDMCGSPHHRKNIEEASADSGTFSLNNRPYDHPRQIRIRPIVDIDIIEDNDFDKLPPGTPSVGTVLRIAFRQEFFE